MKTVELWKSDFTSIIRCFLTDSTIDIKLSRAKYPQVIALLKKPEIIRNTEYLQTLGEFVLLKSGFRMGESGVYSWRDIFSYLNIEYILAENKKKYARKRKRYGIKPPIVK